MEIAMITCHHYNTTQHNTIQYNAVSFNAMRYNTVQCCCFYIKKNTLHTEH